VPIATELTESLFLCSSGSYAEASHGRLKSAVSALKAFQGSETETSELLGGTEENSMTSTRGHRFFTKRNHKKIESVARPEPTRFQNVALRCLETLPSPTCDGKVAEVTHNCAEVREAEGTYMLQPEQSTRLVTISVPVCCHFTNEEISATNNTINVSVVLYKSVQEPSVVHLAGGIVSLFKFQRLGTWQVKGP